MQKGTKTFIEEEAQIKSDEKEAALTVKQKEIKDARRKEMGVHLGKGINGTYIKTS